MAGGGDGSEPPPQLACNMHPNKIDTAQMIAGHGDLYVCIELVPDEVCASCFYVKLVSAPSLNMPRARCNVATLTMQAAAANIVGAAECRTAPLLRVTR